MHLIFCSAFPVFYLFSGKAILYRRNWSVLFLVKTERAKFSFLLGEMLRDETKKAWLRYMQDLSSWLLVNQRGVSGGADVTKF